MGQLTADFALHVRYLAAALLLTASMLQDIKATRIRNSLTLPFCAAGILLNIIISGTGGLLMSAAGFIIPLIALFFLYVLGMLGAGDIKLFSALGSIMGARFIISCICWSFAAGGIMALALLAVRRNTSDRFACFILYCKNSIYTGRLGDYRQFSQTRDAFFRFSFAISLAAVIAVFFPVLP